MMGENLLMTNKLVVTENVRVVLVSTTHPGNIGATARAMKVMGFTNLYLVSPKSFPSEQATALASGADDILEQAIICENLGDALSGTTLAYATTARSRSLSLPIYLPRRAAQEIVGMEQEVALVFGRENAGLTNEQLNLCHRVINIPSNPEFSSLNLAQAVQICLYELKMLSVISHKGVALLAPKGDRFAETQEVLRLSEHLIDVMQVVGYYNQSRPKLLGRRIHRFFGRVGLLRSEAQVFRGFLSAVEKSLSDEED